MPARSIRRCETICASLGFSRKSGRKYWDRRIATRQFAAGVRGALQSSSGGAAKKPAEAKKPRDPVRRFAYYSLTEGAEAKRLGPSLGRFPTVRGSGPDRTERKHSLAGPRSCFFLQPFRIIVPWHQRRGHALPIASLVTVSICSLKRWQ